MRLRLTLIILICAKTIFAQHTLKFAVTDTVPQPEAFATVRIYQLPDSTTLLKATTTDADGKFSYTLPTTATYSINITSTGKAQQTITKYIDRDTNLGTIVMHSGSNTLADVEVVAQRPIVTTEIDRFIYDMKADDESKVSTIFEMLRKVPMVTIDAEENIRVKGSSSFKIYKNGRPNASWSNNPKVVLKSIPATMIKRIEVITEPGAKYDAEGVTGILNIVTDDDMTTAGYTGSIYLSYYSPCSTGAGLYFTTQYKKFTLSANYSRNDASYNNTKQSSESTVLYKATNDIHQYSSNSNHKTELNYINLEASYEIDTLNLLSLSFGGYDYTLHSRSSSTNTYYPNSDVSNPQYSYIGTSLNDPRNKYFDFNGKMDYQHLTSHKDETLTLSIFRQRHNVVHLLQQRLHILHIRQHRQTPHHAAIAICTMASGKEYRILFKFFRFAHQSIKYVHRRQQCKIFSFSIHSCTTNDIQKDNKRRPIAH